jgi:hypothetical protein
MNAARTEVEIYPAWVDTALAVLMGDDAAAAPDASAEEQSDAWLSQVLTECYN